MYVSWPLKNVEFSYKEMWHYLGYKDKLLDIVNWGNYYVVCYRRSFFPDKPRYKEVDILISFSGYRGIKRIDKKYFKIYSGTQLYELLYFFGRSKVYIDVSYPPNVFESIGGLIHQGYDIFLDEDIKLHVIRDGDVKYISLEDVDKNDIILDIHVLRPRRSKKFRLSIVSSEVSRVEAEAILKRFWTLGYPLSILKSFYGFYVVSILYDGSHYRSVKEILSNIIGRTRISTYPLDMLNVNKIPIVRYRAVYKHGLRFVKGGDLPAGLSDVIYLSIPSRDLIVSSLEDRMMGGSSNG